MRNVCAATIRRHLRNTMIMKLENVTYVVNVRNKPPSPLPTTITISITLYFRIHNAQVAPTSQHRFLFVDKFYLAVTSIAINVSSNFISNRSPTYAFPPTLLRDFSHRRGIILAFRSGAVYLCFF